MDETNNKMQIDIEDIRPPQKNRPQPHKNRPQRPKNKAVRALVVTLCVLMAALIGCVIIVYANYSQIWGDLGFDESLALEETETDDVEGLPEVTFDQGEVSQIAKTGNETDILMIGVDNRDSSKFTGRSDVMMYLRVNTEKKTIKLVSFMRDTLVEIDGHGKNKLNTAYGFGSIELAKKTYYQSFGLKPDYYMVVNFFGMEDILDALGGVEIEVQKNELEWLNKCIDEANNLQPRGKVSHVRKSGLQHLSGRQAVAYMRVRHPGGDAARIVRQQNVLNALFTEMKNISMGEIPGLVGAMTQYVRTDMPVGTMVDLAKAVKGMQNSDLQKFRYPQDYKNGNYKGMAIVQPTDFNTEFSKLKAFLAE